MKDNGPLWGMDRFAVCGFSAGGHLAGSLANLWHSPLLSDTLGLPSERFRPDAAILCYPVTMAQPRQGNLLFDNLLGHDVPVEGALAPLSLEQSVSDRNPPTFLWATQTDQMVPVEHTLTYAAALQRAKVPMELHIYPSGPHAMSLAVPESAPSRSYADPHVATWFPLCAEWLLTSFS
jgi:acetyl esterase/lipase